VAPPFSGRARNKAFGNGALSGRGLAIADVVNKVAADIGATPSQVVWTWTLNNPAATAPIISTRTPIHLADNLGALEVLIPDDARANLEEASAIQLGSRTSSWLGRRPQQHIWRPHTRDRLKERRTS
jgi:aryl-alcohol dehydrogenase-like predicted oxidoreductase